MLFRSTIPGGDIGAQGKLTSTGTIIVSEKFDDRWKMVLNGKLIRATETGNGLPKFSITEPGDFIIYHDGTARRGWVSLQFIIVATVIILALPARRRRSQMRAEELA